MLQNRHGCLDDIKLCFRSFSEENVIANDMLTLVDCGCRGKPPKFANVSASGAVVFDDSEFPTYEIYYDMKPTELMDPLLLY